MTVKLEIVACVVMTEVGGITKGNAVKQGDKVRLISGPVVELGVPKGSEGTVKSSEPDYEMDHAIDEQLELWQVDFKVNGEHEDWWVQESEVEVIESAL